MKSSKVQRTNIPSQTLNPQYNWLSRIPTEYRGTRTKYIITHNPASHKPGEEVYIRLSDIGSVHTIDPNSLNFRFVFTRTDKDAQLYNNLAANLVQRLIISLSGKTIYDNNFENLMRTYTDLWLSRRSREELTEFGVCDQLLRNPNTKTEDKNLTQITKKLCNIFNTQKIPIGKIISDQGLMVPSTNLANLEFTLVLADPSKVLSKGSYTLDSCELEYDIIRGQSLKNMVSQHYTGGKMLPFRGLSWLRQSDWNKDQMLINETILHSAACMNQVVMLFTKPVRGGSEEFVFPGIKNVNVTYGGVPGAVYNTGIKTVDLLTEARKCFQGHMNPHDFFCNDMFALVIDLRSTFSHYEFGAGRDTRNGGNITLEIQRDPNMVFESLRCHLFVAYDAILNVNTQGLVSLVQ